jgi:lipoprotein-anchoring transpeptidase ErfK/SrfK
VTAVVAQSHVQLQPGSVLGCRAVAREGEDSAGPNGPVGVVWIDISKPHYGIHGTPEPGTVGHTTSHGCVRLTNWDALKLAAMVGKGTKVEFVE